MVKTKTIIIGFTLGALSFIAALAWNGFIQTVIKEYSGIDQTTIKGQLIYVILITIVVIITAVIISKYFPDDYNVIKK